MTTREQQLDQPAQEVPFGVIQDFNNPQSIQDTVVAAQIVLAVVTAIVVLIRGYSQLRVARKFLLEDYVITLAWLLYTGAFLPIGILAAHAHMGAHQWNLTLRQFEQYLYYHYLGYILWVVVASLLKVAILLQILRIFVPPGIRGTTYWILQMVLWLNVLNYVSDVIVHIFACTPRAKFWDKTITHGKCLDVFGINVVGGSIRVFSDLVILILPLNIIFQMNWPIKKKFGVGVLFAIGIFGCCLSLACLYYDVKLWKNQTDITYQAGYLVLLAAAQVPAEFLIVCLPSVPKALHHLRRKNWFAHIETSVRSALRMAPPKSQESSGTQFDTIGGGRQPVVKRNIVTDIEFHSLVNRTELSVASRRDSRGEV